MPNRRIRRVAILPHATAHGLRDPNGDTHGGTHEHHGYDDLDPYPHGLAETGHPAAEHVPGLLAPHGLLLHLHGLAAGPHRAVDIALILADGGGLAQRRLIEAARGCWRGAGLEIGVVCGGVDGCGDAGGGGCVCGCARASVVIEGGEGVQVGLAIGGHGGGSLAEGVVHGLGVVDGAEGGDGVVGLRVRAAGSGGLGDCDDIDVRTDLLLVELCHGEGVMPSNTQSSGE